MSDGPANDRDIHRILLAQGHSPSFTPSKPRKKRDDEESRNQKMLIKWFRYSARSLGLSPLALMSFPNGGWRSPISASILKAEGQVAGAVDLFLFAGRGSFLGLGIEMKTKTGQLSPQQEAVHDMMRAAGYCVEVCRGWEDARTVIENYLKL